MQFIFICSDTIRHSTAKKHAFFDIKKDMKIQVTHKETKITDDIDVYVWISEVLPFINNTYMAWDLYINSVNLNLIKIQNFSFTKNASENSTCKMVATLSRESWAKSSWIVHASHP